MNGLCIAIEGYFEEHFKQPKFEYVHDKDDDESFVHEVYVRNITKVDLVYIAKNTPLSEEEKLSLDETDFFTYREKFQALTYYRHTKCCQARLERIVATDSDPKTIRLYLNWWLSDSETFEQWREIENLIKKEVDPCP
jgi:hypothetical protein